jgi:hypothetical protein
MGMAMIMMMTTMMMDVTLFGTLANFLVHWPL